MTRGIYEHKPLSEETKRKISLALKDRKLSEKHKRKISETFKKNYKKENHPMWQRHHSENSKRKISLAHKGKKLSEEHKKKISLGNKGKVRSEYYKKNLSEKLKGRRFTEEHKKNISLTQKKGNKHYKWKGDKVGNRGLHYWIRRYKPISNFCEKCQEEKKVELANISGEYKRNINDYKWLCKSCHTKMDFKLGMRRRR